MDERVESTTLLEQFNKQQWAVTPEWKVTPDFVPEAQEVLGKKYSLLAEVNRAKNGLYKNEAGEYVLSENDLEALYFSEKTAAFEAATQGMIWRTWQKKDETGRATGHGDSLVDITQNYVVYLEQNPEKYPEAEIRRQRVELLNTQMFDYHLQQKTLDTHCWITISPSPDDMSADVRKSLGYFGTMINIRDHDPQTGKIHVHQINVDTDMPVLGRFFTDIAGKDSGFDYQSETPSATELLAHPILLSKDEFNRRFPRGVVDVARVYDGMLEEVSGVPYFFGKQVSTKLLYEEIFHKTETVEHQIEPLIQHLVEFDIELAISLAEGNLTESIQKKIIEHLNLRDTEGLEGLSTEQQTALKKALFFFADKRIAEEAVTVLKSLELVRVWSVISSLAHQERAEQLFGRETVQFIQEQYIYDPVALLHSGFINSVIVNAKPQFNLCGGTVDIFGNKGGNNNLFQISLGDSLMALLAPNANSEIESGKSCPEIKCGRLGCNWKASEQEVKKIQKGELTNCPQCGWKP
ncbi:MAG: hypothetical protein UU81_C0008G0012 [Microgenomates group bacterium GW2011_GWC1_41_8]|uniref:Uncharacterized protein n=2 Tax=Candidatus Roizmaniibacteriota TaxID=1752723 RepID=A0A0G0TBK4_9BACT|nr:MAG: hypothetical protein UU14_C0010G0015 [Candidatus Roizmanbacteria bacterium GW2011_GWB1_40_7]KKR94129.1 MAG: hypothetical protein UU41_C0012G0011 [Candidatus Roizmanbacteria bacterium GW2011_GWA1_41_13]KKS24396.1 MAG: hypothetical protein UU81_C0008G0012 [Microgenomates group bacterium GW2011_GWC1_41_8]OGK50317.1 MAG: hypothetical protein A3A55_01300 [Candidatus Roizmanbacteria bacterium RIFCSPLOWO2_01_FULL_40_14]